MRKSNLIVLAIFIMAGLHCSAQVSNEVISKSSNHIIGVQANALIRQIFNFSSANNPVNNPYLLTYTYLGHKMKWGIDAGIGYTLSNSVKNDGNSKSDIKINDLYFRAGVQRHIPLGFRFSSLLNFHALVDVLNSTTKTEFKSGSGSQQSISNTSSSALRYGLGPCVGLRYNVNKRIFVGTEFSYYLKMGKSKGKTTTIITPSSSSSQVTSTTSENDLTEFTLNVPAAIFLSISF